MRTVLAIVLLLSVVVPAYAVGGLDIYLVRHAETLANAHGVDNSGVSDEFSERGRDQVIALTNKLRTMHFDAVLVSSAQRAINTIQPYLKETGQKGEIWPEIAECCWQQEHGDNETGQSILRGTVQLRAEQKEYFIFRDDNSMRNYGNNTYADGVAHVRRAEELLKQKYYGSGKTILIVTHYHSGKVLLSDLLGTAPNDFLKLKNAKLAHLQLDENGRPILLAINGIDVSH